MEQRKMMGSGMLRSSVRGHVLEFNARYDLPIGDRPDFSTEENSRLRAKLILEEALEFERAVADKDFVLAVDALADLLYVVEGAIVAFGLHNHNCMGAVSEEVHSSNMSKLDADGRPIKREDGKVLKGPSYFPANVEGVLIRYGWIR